MSVRQAQMEISSAEFTEWMGYYELEPFGDLIADQRHGVATALLANVNRNAELHPKPFRPDAFIQWRDTGQMEEEEPELLDDPVAQSNLIRASLFGKAPN